MLPPPEFRDILMRARLDLVIFVLVATTFYWRAWRNLRRRGRAPVDRSIRFTIARIILVAGRVAGLS